MAGALALVPSACGPGDPASGAGGAGRPPAAVEAVQLRRGELVLRRTFSGTLEAAKEFVVAPKVGGRLEQLTVDIGDVVTPDAIVARIDDAELQQSVVQAEAEVAVARANHAEAQSAHLLAERALRRIESLSQQGITSESELDSARVNELARRSRVDVSAAGILRAEAAREGARIQLAYATVTASWVDGGPVENGAGHSTDAPLVDTEGVRVVGRRFVDEGGFIAAGTPLLSIVDLDPMTAVVTVPERDYALLRPGLPATLETDAYPGVRFHGEIVRLAPVFNRATRQVRVELSVENRDGRLKPGMFLRAQLELDRLPDAVVVPFAAIAEREGQPGLFVLDPSGERVHWHRVELGVREEAQIAVEGEGLRELADAGRRVVVLGQELCDDGSAVRVIEPETPNAGAPQR